MEFWATFFALIAVVLVAVFSLIGLELNEIVDQINVSLGRA